MTKSNYALTIYGQIASAIYWNSLTEKQKLGIDTILNDSEIYDKANEICNYLNIEKRYNRQAIRQVLAQNSL